VETICRERRIWKFPETWAQGIRIILKKGLRKQEKLGYVLCSYGKKRRLAEHSRRAKSMRRPGEPVTNGFWGGEWQCLPRVLGLVKGQNKSLVQKFTFALTRSGRLGNCDFSQVRALY